MVQVESGGRRFLEPEPGQFDQQGLLGLAQGALESRVEPGYTRNLVIEDRRPVGDGTVSLAKWATGLTVSSRRTKVLTARDADG